MKSFNTKHPKPLNSQSGTALVEFAILFPVFLILVFAVIGFGYIYVIYEAEGRSVSAIRNAMSSAIVPSNPVGWPPITWAEAANFGQPLITFQTPNPKTGPAAGDSTICSTSYATLPEAQAALNSKACDKDSWDASPPTGWTSGKPWYVVVQARVMPALPIPDLYSWAVKLPLPQSTLVTIGAAASTASSAWVSASISPQAQAYGANSFFLLGTTPDDFCKSNGYNVATGSCRIVGPNNITVYGARDLVNYGTLQSFNSDLCNANNGQCTPTTATLCTITGYYNTDPIGGGVSLYPSWSSPLAGGVSATGSIQILCIP